jgi:hypothetical protein
MCHSLSVARCVGSQVDTHRFDATGTCHCGRDGAADPTGDDEDGATDDRDALAEDGDDAAWRNVTDEGKAQTLPGTRMTRLAATSPVEARDGS